MHIYTLTHKTFWVVFITFCVGCYAQAKEYEEIEWIALMPAEDLEVLMNPPEAIFDIADGSEGDSIAALSENANVDAETKRFREALKSTTVVPAYNNRNIRVPGFLVPLDSNEEQKVTSFFIVPYFGACLHLPPPPPNQIIYSTSKEGIALEDVAQPFWFEGKLTIETLKNDMGVAAYTLKLDKATIYEE